MRRRGYRWGLPALVAVFVLSLSGIGTAGEGRVFPLATPDGVPFEYAEADGIGQVQWYGNSAAWGLSFTAKGLGCLAPNEFYSAYITVNDEAPVRARSFASSACEGWGYDTAAVSKQQLGGEPELFFPQDTVTLDIYLEEDDGLSGPDSGELILTGTYNPAD